MTISQRLEKIRIVEGQRKLAEIASCSFAKPLLSDMGGLSALYARFREVCNPKNKDNTKIFVLLAIFCFSPMSFFSKRIPKGGIRQEIGKVLGISGSAVTRHFADAKSLFAHHKAFNAEAERIFSLMQEEIKILEHQQTGNIYNT